MNSSNVNGLYGNPFLLAEVPLDLRSQESNLEVSERLRQLSMALKKTRMQEKPSNFIFEVNSKSIFVEV
jgi:hypothetical protein